MKRSMLLACVILVLLYSLGFAVDPTTKPEERSSQTELEHTKTEGGPQPFPEQMIGGQVTDPESKPLGGVTIKLFADGKLVEVAHTTSNGDYEMPLPLSIEKDETVVLWFVPGTVDLSPLPVVLKESSRAQQAKCFSECTQRVRMRPQMRVDLQMLSDSGLIASYRARGCL
jgi:hypothetical protein